MIVESPIVFIDQLNNRDIIALTETWLGKDDYPNLYFNNYECFSQNRIKKNKKRGGGVLLFIKKTIISNKLDKYTISIPDAIDILTVSITFNNLNFILVVNYRSPDSSLDEYNNLIYTLFSNIKKDIIICGYFNDDISKLNSDLEINMMSKGMYSLIKSPTRITSKSNSILDNFYTHFITDRLSSGIINYELSDHLPIFLNIKLEKHIEINNGQVIYKRTLNKKNIEKLINDLSSIDWNYLYNSDNVEFCYDKFINTFLNSYNGCIPLKSVHIKNNKIKNFITNKIKNAINKKINFIKYF